MAFIISKSVAFSLGENAKLVTKYDATKLTGEMVVEVTRGENETDTVLAIVQPIGLAAPSPAPTPANPGNSINLPQILSTDVFRWEKFPITQLAADAPQKENYKAFFWGYKDKGNTFSEAGSAEFYAIPEKSTITVSAQHCIWLTYAPGDNPALPTYGETINNNRPLLLKIPNEVTSITVTPNPDPNQKWTHHAGANESTYIGRPGTEENVTTADYQNVGGANGITGQAFVLNRLVGLFEYSDKTFTTTELDLGANATTTLKIEDYKVNGKRPVALRLGMHDGYEWTNNDGFVDVTLESSVV